MKPIFAAFCATALIFFLANTGIAQRVKTQTDPPDGFVEIPILKSFSSMRVRCDPPKNGIVTTEQLAALQQDKDCQQIIADLNINPQNNDLLISSASGDCNAEIKTKFFVNETGKIYRIYENEFYGGCAASRFRTTFVVTNKLKENFKFEVVSVPRDERVQVEENSTFLFPKQRSATPPVSLTVKQVDVGNCLKLAGNSQWIFLKEEFLKNAFSNSDNPEQCSALNKRLQIDFDREILVGKTVLHDRCFIPQHATVEVLDDQPNEELTFNIDSVFDKHQSCYEAGYTPVWMVIPRPDGYRRFIFNTSVK